MTFFLKRTLQQKRLVYYIRTNKSVKGLDDRSAKNKKMVVVVRDEAPTIVCFPNQFQFESQCGPLKILCNRCGPLCFAGCPSLLWTFEKYVKICSGASVFFCCLDFDECTNSSVCHENASCTDTVGSFVCTCNRGFIGDGSFCESKAKPQQIMSSQDGATGLASSEAPLPKQQHISSRVN